MLGAKPAIIPNVPALSLTQMRDRLSAIIEENERRGWADRNACPMVVRLVDSPKPGALREHTCYYAVNRAVSTLVGLPEGDVITLEVDTAGQLGANLEKGRRRRRVPEPKNS